MKVPVSHVYNGLNPDTPGNTEQSKKTQRSYFVSTTAAQNNSETEDKHIFSLRCNKKLKG